MFAAIAIPFWLGLLYGLDFDAGLLPHLWHAHEMLFGFGAAAIAGFLLTAVPNWTGREGYSGYPLIGLVLLWLVGRILLFADFGMPVMLVAAIDLAFFPLLAWMILPALLGAQNRGHLAFVGFLALLTVSNLWFHVAGDLTAEALRLGYNTMLLMLTLLGGRVVPAFTSGALGDIGSHAKVRRYAPLQRVTLVSVTLVVVFDLLQIEGWPAASLLFFTAAAMTIQLIGWQGHRIVSMPIVWVLHLGYAWLPICLLLKGLWLIGTPILASAWQHALGVGAMATMIMAIMSRASLGHTGRALRISRPVVLAYGLITLAALMRVFGVSLFPQAHNWLVYVSLTWSVAFLLFLVVYTPILLRPRADGKPG